MNPFGVESHDISKALTPAEKKQKKHHEKRTYQNLAGGIAGLGTATYKASQSADRDLDASMSRSAARSYKSAADSQYKYVEGRAKQGRITPTEAATHGKTYRKNIAQAQKYVGLAESSAKGAKNSRNTAIAAGVAGTGLYANGIRHAIKHDKLEQKGRQRVKKSAWGIEH